MKRVICSDTNETFDNYKDYLNSEHWKIVKKNFYKANERKCNKCYSDKELHIHHLTYKNIGNEDMSDLVCLCKECHFKLHKEMDKINPKQNKKKTKTKRKTKDKTVKCKDCKMFKFNYYCDAFNRSAHYPNKPKKCKKYKKKPI